MQDYGNWRRTWPIFGVVMACFLLVAVSPAAQEVPKLIGRVNDYAQILTPATQRHLEGVLRSFENTDSTQLVVLTVTSLEGMAIEDFSIRVAEQWRIGQKGLDNGAILLISRNDRKLRIEVGYGLEGKLTDLMAGRIVRDVISPAFKAGNFDQGVVSGVEAMMATVKGEYSAPQGGRRASGGKSPIGSLLVPLIAFLFIISKLGRLGRILGAVSGAVFLPVLMAVFVKAGVFWVLASIPIGLLAGLFISIIAGSFSGGRHIGGGYWGGGGFSSGDSGFSSGGFSGGGGGFGGGGASGNW